MTSICARVWLVAVAVTLTTPMTMDAGAAGPPSPLIASSPPPVAEVLRGVSCASARACVAVGDKSDLIGSGDETTLIERWDGVRWSIMASPNPGSINDFLDSVSCISATNCVAVGYFSAGLGERTLVEHWDGTSWSIVASPNAVGIFSFLRGVSCPRVSECVAVGDSVAPSTGNFQTLIETWNGSTWSVTPSPEPGTSSSSLLGVACTSANRCTAAGWNFAGPSTQGLIETWNGLAWSVTPSPSPGTNAALPSVACAGPRSCMAVGVSVDGSRSVTFGETWNGRTWTVTPTFSGGRDNLAGVSCANPNRCITVGVSSVGSGQTLAEVWNGRTWQLTTSPSPGSIATLQSVSCTRPTRCVAVGQSFHESNTSSALAELWNGKQWSVSMTAP